MEAAATTDGLIRALAARFRVVTLGGVAVISHGLGRNTTAADVWVDPAGGATNWADKVGAVIFAHPCARPVRIGRWTPFPQGDLTAVIEEDNVLRVMGLDRPLDIFRVPNELAIEEFDEVWERATPLDDGTRVPDAIDLLVTKQATGRDKDLQDIAFLEAKAERDYLARLPAANAAAAASMLARFLTPKVAEAAMRHAAEPVRRLGLEFLRELAADGDPFAREILERVSG